MQMPGANAEAQRAYASAVEAYERANRIWERALSPKDLKPAAEELEEGRYAMLWAREVLAGRTPPERRTPCFFDPRHGPSARDVRWAPPGETPRDVPACEADAQRVERGEEPDTRYVESDGTARPVLEAGPAFAPFYSGFFPGILIGSMVAGGWDNPTPSDYSGSSGWSGGGDFGGWRRRRLRRRRRRRRLRWRQLLSRGPRWLAALALLALLLVLAPSAQAQGGVSRGGRARCATIPSTSTRTPSSPTRSTPRRCVRGSTPRAHADLRRRAARRARPRAAPGGRWSRCARPSARKGPTRSRSATSSARCRTPSTPPGRARPRGPRTPTTCRRR